MRITPEIKAIMFGQYMMQPCLMNGGSIIQIDGNVISHILTDSCNYDVILKPLSKISDEDIIWVHDTVHNFHEQRRLRPDWAKTVTPPLKDMKDMISNGLAHYKGGYLSDSSVHQYLISKGYDVPMMILHWKTLREAGLAVYRDLPKK